MHGNKFSTFERKPSVSSARSVFKKKRIRTRTRKNRNARKQITCFRKKTFREFSVFRVQKKRGLNNQNILFMLYNQEESYAINGAALQVYKTLGSGFLEAVYQEALELEFMKRGIPYEREKEVKVFYDGQELKQTYRADFVCYGSVIVELKAVASLDDSHRAQVYNYLKATGYKLGLLYNFGHYDGLEWERKLK